MRLARLTFLGSHGSIPSRQNTNWKKGIEFTLVQPCKPFISLVILTLGIPPVHKMCNPSDETTPPTSQLNNPVGDLLRRRHPLHGHHSRHRLLHGLQHPLGATMMDPSEDHPTMPPKSCSGKSHKSTTASTLPSLAESHPTHRKLKDLCNTTIAPNLKAPISGDEPCKFCRALSMIDAGWTIKDLIEDRKLESQSKNSSSTWWFSVSKHWTLKMHELQTHDSSSLQNQRKQNCVRWSI